MKYYYFDTGTLAYYYRVYKRTKTMWYYDLITTSTQSQYKFTRGITAEPKNWKIHLENKNVVSISKKLWDYQLLIAHEFL